jgi:hypothetical protein
MVYEGTCKLLYNINVSKLTPTLLRLDPILPTEHVVDALEIINTSSNGLGTARGYVALLQVSFLAQLAHLVIVSKFSYIRR